MATTNTYAYGITVADAIDEAWERCGKDPAHITARHAKSARNSMALMLSHWSNKALLQWTVDVQEKVTTVGMGSFTPAAGTIDLLDVTLLRDGYETPMTPISREAYHVLPDKDSTGRPNQYFVERKIAPTVFIWPAAENATDTIRYYRIRQIQDTGVLSTNPDIPVRFFEAFVCDLASRLAQKFAPERYAGLLQDKSSAFSEAKSSDGERADVVMSTCQGRYRRRG